MRLATVRIGNATRAVVLGGEGEAAPVDGYADVGALLAAGNEGMVAARAAAELGAWEAHDPAQLVGPIQQPSAVFCVGLNYATHIREMGRELPTDPTLFSKLARSLTGPLEDIPLPAASAQVDYEGELVVVVGTGGRDIAPEDAPGHIGGYTLMNDVTMRDWQYRTLQWFAGKNFEASTPVGPWIVTPDEVDLEQAAITLTVNGEERQRAPLADLVFDPVSLIADISRITTLQPGDLIATGTPGGVGHARKPPAFLTDGDRVDVSVDGIGTLSSRFVSA